MHMGMGVPQIELILIAHGIQWPKKYWGQRHTFVFERGGRSWKLLAGMVENCSLQWVQKEEGGKDEDNLFLFTITIWKG